jgi:ElaB/YqjD/DUF883 family membrane-anchored ribosome-binding protein
MNTISNGTTVKESVQNLANQGGETVHVIKDRATEIADQVKQQSSAVLHRGLDFIQERPIASLGIALVAGFYSRTLFRIGMIAGVGMLVSRLVPKVSGVKDNNGVAAGV